MKRPPLFHDVVEAWREVRWVMLCVIGLLCLIVLYLFIGGPL